MSESFAKNKTERMRSDESILLAPCLISFCYFLYEAFVWYLSLRTICSTEYFESRMNALSYLEMFYGLAFDFLLIEYKWISFIRCLTKIIIWNRIIWINSNFILSLYSFKFYLSLRDLFSDCFHVYSYINYDHGNKKPAAVTMWYLFTDLVDVYDVYRLKLYYIKKAS